MVCYTMKNKSKQKSGSNSQRGHLRMPTLFLLPDKTKEENVMVELITNVNNAVNGFVWGVPMLVLLVGTGILMTVLT